MLTWAQAVETARQLAVQNGASQVVAECATAPAELPERFVVGPARGWSPSPAVWLLRAKVREDGTAPQLLEAGWRTPGSA